MSADSAGEPGLASIVDLVVQVDPHGFEPIVHIPAGRQPASQPEHANDSIEVPVDHLGKSGVLDLEDDLLASLADPRPVHLGQRGRCKGLPLDVQFRETRAQILFQDRRYRDPRKGLGAAAQFVQSLGQRRRQKVFT